MNSDQNIHNHHDDENGTVDPDQIETPSEWPHFLEDSIFESTTAELSYSMEIAVEMAQLAVLGVMATACQGLFDVAYPGGKDTVPLSLMTCTIAGSSEGKTRLKNWTDLPIKEFEAAQSKKRMALTLAAQRLHSTWKIKIKALERKLARAMVNDETPEKIAAIETQLVKLQAEEPPTHKNARIIYENSTSEALTLSLYENYPSAFLSSSESGNLLNGPAFRDMYIYNSLYSGSTLRIDRSSQPSIMLSSPRLSVCIMLQPEAMDRFLRKNGREAHDNGFLARFLFIRPEEMAGRRTNNRPPISDHVEKCFYSRVIALLTESLDAFDNDEDRKVLRFSSSAKVLWKKLFDNIEHEIREGGIYYYSKSHAGKLMENTARIAGTIHAFEGYQGDIKSHTLEYAYKFCRKCSQDYLEHLAEEPEIVTLTNLMVQDIRKHGTTYSEGYRFKRSLFQQKGHSKLRCIKSRNLALETLKKLGHLIVHNQYGGDLEFSDTVWPHIVPEIKNGEGITFSELPLWENQQFVMPGSRGRYPPKRIIKSNGGIFN